MYGSEKVKQLWAFWGLCVEIALINRHVEKH